MNRLLRYFYILLFLILITGFKSVLAEEIFIEDVIAFMSDNNIFEDSEYFYMFGKVLNGNGNYNIVDFSYTVHREDDVLNIIVILTDKNYGAIKKTISLSLEDNLISYVNKNDVDSLESRIVTIIFNQLIYSVGGARGYNKDIIVNWMNQIDLNEITKEKGIDLTYETVIYSVNENNRTYEYEVKVPKSFTIDINSLTNEIPLDYIVEVSDIKTDLSSVSMRILAKNHIDEICTIYRKNIENEYEMVGNVACDNAEFVDTNLDEGTTYYYQVSIKDKIMCSNEFEVTTDTAPKTGAFMNVFVIVILVIIDVFIYKYCKNNKILQKI